MGKDISEVPDSAVTLFNVWVKKFYQTLKDSFANEVSSQCLSDVCNASIQAHVLHSYKHACTSIYYRKHCTLQGCMHVMTM